MQINRTGNADFPDRLKCLVSGPPKSGKTSLLGTVPNIIIADTESDANNLASIAHLNIPYVKVESLSDVKDLAIVLRDKTMRDKTAKDLGMEQIEAVAIDTLDTLQNMAKKERLRDTRQSQMLRDDWAWLKEEMDAIIRLYTSLPLHVFFMVHTKSKEMGKSGDDARTIVLPNLQGSIDEEVAGMVGYSLLTFRKQEVGPDGHPYTKYWLRTEGDETYTYLGNRASGRLPDVIEPSFAAVYAAAMGDRLGVVLEEEQVTQKPPAVQVDVPETPAAPPASTTPPPPPEEKPSDDDPVNAAALTHTKRVYDALGIPFPEEIIKGLNIGQARTLVKMWKACQQDEAEGKMTDGQNAQSVMLDYLTDNGWVQTDVQTGEDVLDISKPIAAIQAYVGEDAVRAQEALDAEVKRPTIRASLVEWLKSKGAAYEPTSSLATEPADGQNEQAVVGDVAPDATASEPAAEPTPPEADPHAAAASVAAEILGAEVTSDPPCEGCGKDIDDVDIANLSRARHKKWLCVNCYITENKKASA